MPKFGSIMGLLLYTMIFSCHSVGSAQVQSINPKRPVALVYQGPGSFDSEDADPNSNSKVLQAFLKRFLVSHGKQEIAVVMAGAKEMREYLADSGANEIVLLAFPGGPDATLMYNSLKKNAALAPIKNYLQQGGRYLGICAGAYLAASYFDDSPDKPLPSQSIIGLGLLPAKSSSLKDLETVTEFEKGLDDSDAAQRGNVFFWRDKSVEMFFQNGPAFHFDESAAHVLARYQTQSSNVKTREIIFPEDRFPAAAVVLSYGAGQANIGLFSMHPEAPQAWRQAAAMKAVSNKVYDELGFELLTELLP